MKLIGFDYHMKLHYSQTLIRFQKISRQFDYHMKLHYSQTSDKIAACCTSV